VYEGAIQDLIDELGRLPGVGPKSAQRIAFHILSTDPVDVKRLALALQRVKELVRFCTTCFNVAESEQCRICRDARRHDDAICVVEEPKDVVAIEKTGEFRGRYHVLGGAFAPIDGVGPDELRIAELETRVKSGEIAEVVLATNPNAEGDATAHFLIDALRPTGVRLSRIAFGMPLGGDLEYADHVTVGMSVENRRTL
jgi:recombination protein RecR